VKEYSNPSSIILDRYALDMLKQRIKKDEALCKFLTEAECNVLCRKLQLKDMLPVEMQRLVKYPLLLEVRWGASTMRNIP
jgi:hypothetical protein